MPKALIVHNGFTTSERLREVGEKYRGSFEINYATSRLGPEATFDAAAEVVVTENGEVAEYWEVLSKDKTSDVDVKVVRVCTLPKTFPGRKELSDGGLLTLDEVREVASAQMLPTIEGIGEATADKIRQALGMEPIYAEDDE